MSSLVFRASASEKNIPEPWQCDRGRRSAALTKHIVRKKSIIEL